MLLPVLQVPLLALPPLGEPAPLWSAVPAASLVEVGTGAPQGQGTTVRAAWSAAELRIVFDCADRDPWATLTERDAPLYTEEVVEIFLDPVGDLSAYFELEVNPRNAVLDLIIRRGRAGLVKDFRWRCAGLQTHVALHPGSWRAEFSIPLASVAPEPPIPGARWRANFCRIDRPPGVERELTAWSPTGAPQFHVPARFGFLEFQS